MVTSRLLAAGLLLLCCCATRSVDALEDARSIRHWDADADHYRTLGLRRNAQLGEVKRAFRRMSLLHHPDKARRGDPDAKKRFERIVQAHDVLVDEKKRRAYDAKQEKASFGFRSQKTRDDRRWSASSPLVTLHPATIEKQISRPDGPLWLVLFRGGRWCEVCDDAETHFHNMARELRGVASLGVLDCDVEGDLDAAWERGGNDACSRLELDPDTLPVVLSFAPGAASLELGEQVTKTTYESKQDLDDTLSFLTATVRAAYSAGVADAERKLSSSSWSWSSSSNRQRRQRRRRDDRAGGGRGDRSIDDYDHDEYEDDDDDDERAYDDEDPGARSRGRRGRGSEGGGGRGGFARDDPRDRGGGGGRSQRSGERDAFREADDDERGAGSPMDELPDSRRGTAGDTAGGGGGGRGARTRTRTRRRDPAFEDDEF